jgi:hypothetical protein
MSKIKGKKSVQEQVTMDGLLTVGKLEDGRRRADFQCCEEVELEKFVGRFKVQGMHDGNLYMEEYPKRLRNKPMFRQDNSSLSLGRNGVYYFVFTLPEEQLAELPEKLVRQANEAAAKVSGLFYKK